MNARFNVAWQFLKQDEEEEEEGGGPPIPLPPPSSADRDAPAVTNIEQQAQDPSAWRGDLRDDWENIATRNVAGREHLEGMTSTEGEKGKLRGSTGEGRRAQNPKPATFGDEIIQFKRLNDELEEHKASLARLEEEPSNIDFSNWSPGDEMPETEPTPLTHGTIENQERKLHHLARMAGLMKSPDDISHNPFYWAWSLLKSMW